MSIPNFNCFSGLAWTVQCPVFLEKGFGSCFLSSLSRINPGSFTGHVAARGLRALPGGARKVTWGILCNCSCWRKDLVLKDHLCPGTQGFRISPSATRNLSYVSQTCVEGESVDLGWY